MEIGIHENAEPLASSLSHEEGHILALPIRSIPNLKTLGTPGSLSHLRG